MLANFVPQLLRSLCRLRFVLGHCSTIRGARTVGNATDVIPSEVDESRCINPRYQLQDPSTPLRFAQDDSKYRTRELPNVLPNS